MLLEKLKTKAIEKGLVTSEEKIGLENAYLLVRDMTYARASSRKPEVTIDEWRGTCSGKHYLLKELFTELGYPSRLIACTTISHLNPEKFRGKIRKLLEQSNGRVVDVHNYIILELPKGEMIVDATWPISTKGLEVVVNKHFVLGEDQKIAARPIESWEVPDDRDPQEFKEEILKANFTQEELEHREEFFSTISKLADSK